MSWESPIDGIISNIQTRYEDGVIKAVQSVGFNVNKEELAKALQYDRGQYEKGRADGYMQRDAEIVRCKDCAFHRTHITPMGKVFHICNVLGVFEKDDFFCAWGEKREDEI